MGFFAVVAAVVLFVSYRASAPPGRAVAADEPLEVPGGAAGTSAPPGAPTASPKPSRTASAPKKKPAREVVDGAVVRTRWGPVQVRAVIVGGRLADVVVLQMPALSGRERELNAYAMPRLEAAAIEAQSADIDVVSGATATSEGYLRSLQAALDAAHLQG
jgi:uncharacterized protein with FMN-binding domain